MTDTIAPPWKRWYRWPFLLVFVIGLAMVVFGVQQCIALVHALRTLPREVVVNTAMSAFPPLGIGIMATGALGWLPRTADNRGLRPWRTRSGRDHDPGAIVVVIALVALVLYPIAGIAVKLTTENILSQNGYSEQVERVSPSSRYITSRWTR